MVDGRNTAVPGEARVFTPESYRKEAALLVIISALLHLGLAAQFRSRNVNTERALRQPSKVEVHLARAPSPPPLAVPESEPPPQLQKPPPKARAAASKPSPHPPEPSASRVVAEGAGSVAPEGLEGTLPLGGGESDSTAASAPAPPPPRALAPPPPVIAAREGVHYLKNPRPAYPKLALREEWEGQVLLRVQVLPSGQPGAISVEKSAGRRVLDEAAIEAVRRWTFMPAMQGGKPIPGSAVVPIVFRLQ